VDDASRVRARPRARGRAGIAHQIPRMACPFAGSLAGSNVAAMLCFAFGAAVVSSTGRFPREHAMSLGTILIILVLLYLLGGWSGRFGGYGYGLGHSGMGLGTVILIILLVLVLLGKL